MTIKELVEQLQQGRPDDEVLLRTDCGWRCCQAEWEVATVVLEQVPDGTRVALYVVQGNRVERA